MVKIDDNTHSEAVFVWMIESLEKDPETEIEALAHKAAAYFEVNLDDEHVSELMYDLALESREHLGL